MADTHRKRITYQFNMLCWMAKEYRWLLETRMVEFFASDAYDKLPASWKMLNSKSAIEDFGPMIDFANASQHRMIYPLSILSLRVLLNQSTIPRKESALLATKQISNKLMRNDRFRKLFNRHVKPKKRYEIETFAAETFELAKAAGVQWVIDVGSGLGHLCRTLAFFYGLNVCGIETQKDLSEKARKWDEEIIVNAGKFLDENDMLALNSKQPHHKEVTVSFNTKGEDLLRLLQECSGDNEKREFGITGLHPCGDLAAILLNIFVTIPQARFINIIGCCYHKATLSGCNVGFPLSTIAKEANLNMTVDMASLGSHALEGYISRLQRRDYDHLKIHCFRATLEEIILKNCPESTPIILNNVKANHQLSFSEYCEKAVKNTQFSVRSEDITSKSSEDNLSRWKDVVFYFCVWTMMGPVIESIFQLDRLLLLQEKDDKISSKLSATNSNIEEINNRHEEIEKQLTEWRDKNAKRDDELQEIRRSIKECVSKVSHLKQILNGSENGKASTGTSSYGEDSLRNDCCQWTICNPGNIKVAIGAAILWVLLKNDGCYVFLPSIPVLYSFLYLCTLFNHLVLVTSLPFVRDHFLAGILEDSSIEQLNSLFYKWYYIVCGFMSVLALLLWQMKNCTTTCGPWSIGPSIQILSLVANYIMLLIAYGLPDLIAKVEDGNDLEKCCHTNRVNRWSCLSLLVNIFVSLTIR